MSNAAKDEKELVKLAKDACRKSDSYFRMYQVWNRNLDRIRTTPQMKIRNDHQDTWNAWSRHAYTLCRLSGVELSRGVLSWAEWQGKPVPAPVTASN